jgi:hypothetical protein
MEPRSAPSQRLAAFGLVLLFAAAFAASSWALRDRLPGGTGLERTETKFEYFAARKDGFDLLFFGSSRTYRGFDPALFDAELARRGISMRSFNFGLPGSRAVEVQHLLGRVVALKPRNVRFCLVDPEGLSALPDHRNFRARAVIDWHDLEMTGLVTRYVLETEPDQRRRAELVWAHWTSCALNLTNVGRGLGWVDGWLGRRPPREFVAETVGERGDGYTPLGEEGAELGRRGKRFKNKRVDDYLARLEEYRELRVSRWPPSEAAIDLYRRIERHVRDLGATTIFVTQPALYLQEDLIKAHARGDVAHLVRYDDPQRFPELYAPENRYDDTHLNEQGARLFTEHLARDVAELIEREGLAR